MHWREALDRPGAAQMRYVRELIESRSFLDRVPDQSLIADNYAGANYMTATRGAGYAYIYSPNGIPFTVVLGKLEGSEVKASWFDPRTGEYRDAGHHPNAGETAFAPPTSGRGNDWVLVLEV